LQDFVNSARNRLPGKIYFSIRDEVAHHVKVGHDRTVHHYFNLPLYAILALHSVGGFTEMFIVVVVCHDIFRIWVGDWQLLPVAQSWAG
jgi:hypothetical protein